MTQMGVIKRVKSSPMKIEEQLRHVLRLKHDSYKTEESHVGWAYARHF